MRASLLLTLAEVLGIEVSVEEGDLRLQGPKGAMSEALLCQVRAKKGELLELLQAAPAACSRCAGPTASAFERCTACASPNDISGDLPPPCPQCEIVDWTYESRDYRRCTVCGHEVTLPAMFPMTTATGEKEISNA